MNRSEYAKLVRLINENEELKKELHRIKYGQKDEQEDGIKIIKPGDINLLRKIKRFSCDLCGCIWEADKDHYKYLGNPIDGDSYCCNCPTCGATTYVPK